MTEAVSPTAKEPVVSIPPVALIADDDPPVVDVFRACLTGRGYETMNAADGDPALPLLRQELPDLGLLDLVMLGLDGLEVCRRITADPASPFMPVITTAGRGSGKSEPWMVRT